MGKIKHSRKSNFTTIDNTVIKDNSLTWKARGIFNYLWSMPEDWDFYMTEVVNHSVDGMTALKSGIKELEEHGYLRRTRIHGDGGKIESMLWELSDAAEFKEATKQSDNNSIRQETNLMGTEPLLNKNNTKEKNTLNKDSNNILSSSHSTASHADDYKMIIDYLNQKAGTNYRSTSQKTQRLINARFNEGFSVDDFKQVVDIKVSQWSTDSKMSKYLRPETLFGTKFEGYLNEKPKYTKPQINNELGW